MRRRELLAGAGGGLCAAFASVRAPAQRPGAVPVVGVLFLAGEQPERQRLNALRDGLRANGLIDGDNVRLAVRYADGDADRLGPLARDLAAAGSRLVVTVGTTSVRAAHTALPGMPIVMAGSADPVEMGFARSLARPGGKVTGLSVLGRELIGKRIELLTELVPTAKAFVALLHAANPGNAVFQEAFAAAARSRRVDITVREVRTLQETTDALAWSARLPAGGVYVIEDPVFLQHREAIFHAALAERLPTMTGNASYAHAGALAAYSVDILDIWRRAAGYVAAILRGADPGDLPIEQPTKLTLAINLKTAKALGITIPLALMDRADEVIE